MNKQQIIARARVLGEDFTGLEPVILEERAEKAAEFLAEEKKFATMAKDRTKGAEYHVYCEERARLARVHAYDEMGSPELVEFMGNRQITFD